MLLAVAEVHARYHQPARYDDEVVISTCLEAFPSRGMTFTYEVRRAIDGVLLVTGSTKHIAIDGSGRTKRISEEMRARMTQGPNA